MLELKVTSSQKSKTPKYLIDSPETLLFFFCLWLKRFISYQNSCQTPCQSTGLSNQSMQLFSIHVLDGCLGFCSAVPVAKPIICISLEDAEVNKPVRKGETWHLNWLWEETEAGSNSDFFLPVQLALQLFTVWALKSLSLSASRNPLHTPPESTWAFRKGHIYLYTDTKDTRTHPLQLSPSAYSGVRTASFSLGCGSSMITDGRGRI